MFVLNVNYWSDDVLLCVIANTFMLIVKLLVGFTPHQMYA